MMAWFGSKDAEVPRKTEKSRAEKRRKRLDVLKTEAAIDCKALRKYIEDLEKLSAKPDAA